MYIYPGTYMLSSSSTNFHRLFNRDQCLRSSVGSAIITNRFKNMCDVRQAESLVQFTKSRPYLET